MNALLAQFLTEADDLLAQVDEGLLRLERAPQDTDLVNGVFRAAHTLKGSSGLFDFPELTRLTHAAEDLLDAVRGGRLDLDAAMTDDLLASFDLIRGWLVHVTSAGRLPATAGTAAGGLIERLRRPLGGSGAPAAASAAAAADAPAPAVAVAAPRWAAALGGQWLEETAGWLEATSATLRLVRYTPDEDCYFRGEDPLHLLRQVPAVDRLVPVPPAAWPSADDYDEYACLLDFVLATRAAPVELAYLFRYVPEQVEIVELGASALTRLLAGEGTDAGQEAGQEAGLEAGQGQGAGRQAGAPQAGQEAGAPQAGQEAGAPQAGTAQAADARAVLEAALHTLSALPEHAAERATRLASAGRAVRAAAHVLGRDDVPRQDDPRAVAEAARRLLEAAQPVPGPPDAATSVSGDSAEAVQVGSRTLKVEQEKVDRLMELVGELNVAKNALTFLAASAEEEFGSRLLARRIKDQYAGMHRIAEELQAAVMDVRMLPLSVAFARFPRLVRDLGRKLGKSVELVTEGEEVMADKDVIEALGDPLVHLVRNSLDHGVEAPAQRVAAGKEAVARIRLSAVSDGDAVVVEVTDDGAGIDPGAIKRKAYEKGLITEARLEAIPDAEAADLVFLPGFSTAETVSDVSGRGVGMDAVRASVERLGGTVGISSAPGAGTTTRLRLPLSMAVTQVMVFSAAGQRFGVPVDTVAEAVRVPAGGFGRVLHQDVIQLRGEVVPVIDLAATLHLPWTPPEDIREVLVTQVGGQKVGLLVERLHREMDVILKPMEGLLAGHGAFSGTALLGDGLVLLVLNIKEVLGVAARAA
ncbi:chemotaxis protein CheA [Planomonospora sp. ID82291]|uniref:chemotaxis protein CheA n=1 Tax=Planomonospora sp. ID82291 TaxID=2738136 RepID=UPI0018C35694|nr:chemotaxis protein CheA [Planomonospora sp. ID82291]MBG0818599.1 chemotaxis protein CheA [Planomonospora sp. ID82291]